MSDTVYTALSGAIRSLQLPPGTALSEPVVAAELNVSRTPVREAFARLVDLGLVTVIPQVGTTVAPISLREVGEAVFIRKSLETSAFGAAIADGPPDVSTMQSLVDANVKAAAAGDVEQFFTTDESLHQQVFVLAGYPRMWEVVQGAKVQLDRLRRLNLSSAMRSADVLSEHQQIVDALAARDARAGVRVIAKHSTRILQDTARLRDTHPEFFSEVEGFDHQTGRMRRASIE